MSLRLGLTAIATLLAACMGGFAERDLLLDAVREYNDGVRWGRLDQATSHLPIAARQRLTERLATLGDELEFSEYDLGRIDVEGERARVRVDVSWLIKRRGLLERTTLEQSWQRKGSSWLLIQENRVAGAPLPLWDEPVATTAAR